MATSPNDVTVLYELKFTQLFELLAQQTDLRIPKTCRQQDYRGSQGAQVIKQAGVVNVDLRVNRLEPIQFTDSPLDARWAYPVNYDMAIPFDSFDEIQTMADPRSIYVEQQHAAMNRQMDAEVIRGFYETSHTGQTGGSTTTFPTSTNQIAYNFGASAATGLTVIKLRQARLLLRQNEVDLDMEDLYAVLGATQEDNLLAEAQVVSTDFNDKPVLVDGKIKSFLGIDFIHSEQLPMDSTNTYALVPVYSNRAMAFGTWMPPSVKITQREDLRGRPWQIYINAAFGATRLQEKKVMQIQCNGH
ncbi:MAG: phage capsid protein [Candidatus Acidiferrales bacterium]